MGGPRWCLAVSPICRWPAPALAGCNTSVELPPADAIADPGRSEDDHNPEGQGWAVSGEDLKGSGEVYRGNVIFGSGFVARTSRRLECLGDCISTTGSRT